MNVPGNQGLASRLIGILLAGWLAGAACTPRVATLVPSLMPTAAEGAATLAPTGLALVQTTPAPADQTPAVSAGADVTPAAAPVPTMAPTPAPKTLVVCQKDEPLSLYLYGDNTTARAGIFEALFDGPIDAVGYAYQPVILEALPSIENGGLTVSTVEVRPGDLVVDAVTGAVVPLGEKVQLAQPDGSRVIYEGTEPARTLQLSAGFKIKAGLRWSDGQPLTADDSLFSYEVAASADTPASKVFIDRTARYEAVDDRTLRWTGLPGWLDTNYFLRFWTPLPRHRFGQLSPADLLKDSEAAQRPLGWGAFVLDDWQPGDHLTLTRNPYYFRAAEGLPRLDQVIFRFGLDPAQVLVELQAGRCDVGAETAGWSDQLQTLLAARDAGWLAPQFVADTAFEHLDFGIMPVEDYKRPAGNDLFQDSQVRHAFAYCLDRQALVDKLLAGLAEVPASYLPARHPQYAGDLVTLYAFNPGQGQALLAAAGWTDTDGDGIRENGKRKLVVQYATGPETDLVQASLVEMVQAQLRANCGIETQIQLYAPETLYEVWPRGVLFGRKFDLGVFPWRAGIQPPCDLYVSEAIPSDQNPGGANDTGYSNPAFDRACHAALAALDAATARAMHQQAQAIFTRDLPSLPLFFRVKAGAVGLRVQGYQLDSTATSGLWNIEQLGVAATP
jgi:peptide/nickel transport system substrate-binding protein